ncbi:MAG: T9SS type A sorting domain-containing protein [Bacteroidales bacterium]|nr:T9SS type A sorting domain-containing protein [Bacteroidales bacterium]MBN2820757.1 T9SS type A sorting domain-containing protein [Bacteroidales bacterium]
MTYNFLKSLCLSFIAIVLFSVKPLLATQDDTVFVHHITDLPTIDGNGNDACWELCEWQEIDQVWITWGDDIPEGDFAGAYKVLWSSETNLLYFLVKAGDDVRVDGYVKGQTADNYHFDIIEVFLDENNSRGNHLFDDGTNNAENAFAFHIYADYPAEGETNTVFDVSDLAGTNWGTRWDPDYSNHFGDFTLAMAEDTAYWEFSLQVHNDTYIHTSPDNSRVNLTNNKVMGLSLAYCDNDGADEDPNSATRDNFYGSVVVPQSAYNDHYMDATYFGLAKLVDGPNVPLEPVEPGETAIHNTADYGDVLNVYPVPATNEVSVEFLAENSSNYVLLLFDLNGKEIQRINGVASAGLNSIDLNLHNIERGIYTIQIQNNNTLLQSKISVL